MSASANAAERAIVFSHGNSFPAGTYRSLFEIWRRAGYEVWAVEKFGHDPRFPVTSNWPHLRDQLVDFIQREPARPVHLVGHSLGGYLSLLAAARRPDLALGLVLLDSPILSGWKARALQIAKVAGVGERLSPGQVSKRRRNHWPSAAAAHAHFAGKPLFARWAPAVLNDYIEAGTRAERAPGGDSGARTLAFDRETETAIYNSLPHQMDRILRAHPLQCPMAFVAGSQSAEVRRVGLAATRRLSHGRVSTIEGTHLFPMEKPEETAQEVLRWLASFSTPCAPS